MEFTERFTLEKIIIVTNVLESTLYCRDDPGEKWRPN